MDNCTYKEDVDIIIKEKSKLLIIAADWPAVTLPDALTDLQERITGDIVADGLQPVLQGNIVIHPVTGSPPDFEEKTGGQITLNGLLIQGNLTVAEGNLGVLNLNNCTIVPDSGKIEIGADTSDLKSNQWLKVTVQRTICGPLNFHDTMIDSLIIEDCIIDDFDGDAILVSKAPLQINRATILGKVTAKTLTAENCIFQDAVIIERKQTGCAHFSFVPYKDSLTPPETPRRFHCQPDLEINNRIADAKNRRVLTLAEEDAIRKTIVDSLVPSFTSIHFGDYGYAQLSISCPVQISAGADNGAEMGAFNFLKQPQRRANLLIALDEYLRLGLEAGLIYVT